MNKITVPVLQESKSSGKSPGRDKGWSQGQTGEGQEFGERMMVWKGSLHRLQAQNPQPRSPGSEFGPAVYQLFELQKVSWKFSGCSGVRDLGFHCQGSRFNPWLGELGSHKLCGTAKKKKREKVSERLCTPVISFENKNWDFLCGPVVKTLCSHCRGHEFNPWSGNQDPSCYRA